MGFVKDHILEANNKQVAHEITKRAIEDQQSFEALMQCFLSDNSRLCQCASNPLSKIGELKPQLLIPYYPNFLEQLERPKHDAVVRNIFRIWQFVDIPEAYEGFIYDKSIAFLENPNNAIAIRVFAMTVASNIALKYPALIPEVVTLIELYFDNGSAGFKSRATKLLKKMSRTLDQKESNNL